MVYVDLHAHLDFEVFDRDRNEILKKMKDENIIVLTNTLNPKNYNDAKKMFSMHKNVHVCPGLYPQDAEKISDKEFDDYLNLIEKEKDFIKAIGEVGLDRHHSKDLVLWKLQEKRLRAIIELAIKIDKPVILHTRKAEKETLDIIEEYVVKYGFIKFNLHCFSGKKKLINKIKELKIYCSIPLIVLNTESFRILVKEMPVNKLFAETDSPFLNPSKERNSSLNIPIIYKEIAKIKGLNECEIEHIIFRNYQKFTM